MEIKDMVDELQTAVKLTPEVRIEIAAKLVHLSELLKKNEEDIDAVFKERENLRKKIEDMLSVPSERAAVLREAEKMVCGHREQDYGDPEDNFSKIAVLWSAYFGHSFTALDVAMMMTLMKIGRICTGTATEDSFVDACGYLACGAEIKGDINERKNDSES